MEEKQKKELHLYPAVFNYEEHGITVGFIDIPGAMSFANTEEEAVLAAKHILAQKICIIEEEGGEFPKPTPLSEVRLRSMQRVFQIDVWMPYYRARRKPQCAKKTLTIPSWLNVLAEHNNVNFSALLRKALMQQLGVVDKDRF